MVIDNKSFPKKFNNESATGNKIKLYKKVDV